MPFHNIESKGGNLVELIEKWQNSVFEYCGRDKANRYDTSVFLHESCVYLEVRKILANRGIDVVQVYDGFYFKKGTCPKDMNRIIERACKTYYNKFIKKKEPTKK